MIVYNEGLDKDFWFVVWAFPGGLWYSGICGDILDYGGLLSMHTRIFRKGRPKMVDAITEEITGKVLPLSMRKGRSNGK